MKIIYQCDYDWMHRFDTEEDCKKHEENCSTNPKVRACLTCKNSTDYCNGGKTYYGCKKEIIEASPIAFKKHCEFWEHDEKYERYEH